MTLELALDLGSSVTRLASTTLGIVFEEPTIAAVDEDAGRLLAFGRDALGLGANCAGRVRLRDPVRHGQLVDLELAEQAIETVLIQAGANRLSRPRVVVVMHVNSTEVQRRALERALRRAGARQVSFVEQPIAAALGAGLEIGEPVGQMVVDVGGGTTDIGVIALGGIVAQVALPLGCDDLDELLRVRLARRDRLVIERETAAEIRRQLGLVLGSGEADTLEVSGRDQRTGTPRRAYVRSTMLAEALEELLAPIASAATACITAAPPDLANDLLSSGIVLCGGGSHLFGLAQRLGEATGVPIHVSSEGGRLAVLGATVCATGDGPRALAPLAFERR